MLCSPHPLPVHLYLRRRSWHRHSDLELVHSFYLFPVLPPRSRFNWLYLADHSHGLRNLMLVLDSLTHYSQASRIFIYTCSVFALLTLLPAGYAVFWTSACRYPLASDYIQYAAFNTMGDCFIFYGFLKDGALSNNGKLATIRSIVLSSVL